MKRCQFCAEDIQDAAVVCPRCRSQLLPPWRRRRVQIAALVVLLVTLGWSGYAVITSDEFARARRQAKTQAEAANAPLAMMSIAQRDAAIQERLQSKRRACPTVVRTRLIGMPDGPDSAIWAVDCGGGVLYALVLTNDGTSVMDCVEARRLGTPCFE